MVVPMAIERVVTMAKTMVGSGACPSAGLWGLWGRWKAGSMVVSTAVMMVVMTAAKKAVGMAVPRDPRLADLKASLWAEKTAALTVFASVESKAALWAGPTVALKGVPKAACLVVSWAVSMETYGGNSGFLISGEFYKWKRKKR